MATHGAKVTIAGAIAFDGFDVFIQIVVSIAMLLTALVADGYLRREGVDGPEFHVLAMLSASGAMIMGAANDLIVIFLGLEILSIALYVLAAINRSAAESGEAGLKYFVLGAFSSAVFVYGIALIYGATGSSNLPQIADFLSRTWWPRTACCWPGWPSCWWASASRWRRSPSTCGRPTSTRGHPRRSPASWPRWPRSAPSPPCSGCSSHSFGTVRADWQPIVWAIAFLSLLLGAVVALMQKDVKRMMAYSSINHAGFILLGVEAATGRGCRPSLYYLFTYIFLVIGSFAVITVMAAPATSGTRSPTTGDWPNASRCWPWPSPSCCWPRPACPSPPASWPSSGWSGRRWPPTAYTLAAVAMVSAAIAAFFYLRVAVTMYSPVGIDRRCRRSGRARRPGAGRCGGRRPGSHGRRRDGRRPSGSARRRLQPAGAHR